MSKIRVYYLVHMQCRNDTVISAHGFILWCRVHSKTFMTSQLGVVTGETQHHTQPHLSVMLMLHMVTGEAFNHRGAAKDCFSI